MARLKEEMWKQVCEALHSVALNVLEKLNNSMLMIIADKGGVTKH